MEKKQSKAKSNKYKITLETVGREYKVTADTIEEGLKAISLEWHQIKNKGVIKIKKGDRELEHLFYLQQLKRIFANKLTLQLWSKRLELLLKQ